MSPDFLDAFSSQNFKRFSSLISQGKKVEQKAIYESTQVEQVGSGGEAGDFVELNAG